MPSTQTTARATKENYIDPQNHSDVFTPLVSHFPLPVAESVYPRKLKNPEGNDALERGLRGSHGPPCVDHMDH